MAREWLLVITGFFIVPTTLLLMLSSDVDSILTEAHQQVGLPPGATNVEWGEIPAYWEGPMRPDLPIKFDLPPGTDLQDMLNFYRDRCEALEAISYYHGLNPEGFGPSSGMCRIRIESHTVAIDFQMQCNQNSCKAEQRTLLEN